MTETARQSRRVDADAPGRRLVRLVLAASLAAALPLAGACGDKPARDADAGRGGGVATVDGAADRASITASYDRGLDFLSGTLKDGVLLHEGKPQIGMSAIALTAFLERPGGLRDKDRAAVDKGLATVAKTLEEDGSVANAYRPNYETAVVIMALAASGKPEYKDEIARAAGFIKSLQRLEEDNPTYGGIGYGSDNTRSDLSNTQYALASLRAAGIPEDDPVFQRALTFLSRTQNRRENEGPGEPSEWVDKKSGDVVKRGDDGGANYYPGNSKAGYELLPDGSGRLRSYGSMTYALLRCYHFAGLDASDPRVAAALEWVAENWTLDENPGMADEQAAEGLYYYYATMAKTLPLTGRKTLDAGGRTVDWRKELAAELLRRQTDQGFWVNAQAERWQEGNPVLATSYALAALAACAE